MDFVFARSGNPLHKSSTARFFGRFVNYGAGIAFSCAAVQILLVGCNRSSQEAQVSGRVTLDGGRIGLGMIVFAPVGGGKPATGSIAADGSYDMKTSYEFGLAPGKYKVAISIRELPKNVQRGDQPPPGKLLIPAKYEQSATSRLEYDVIPGNNTIDINLTSS
jgi:hypothetical protein